jgi:hypothetical protein
MATQLVDDLGLLVFGIQLPHRALAATTGTPGAHRGASGRNHS